MTKPENSTVEPESGIGSEIPEIDKSEILSEIIIELYSTVDQFEYALRVLIDHLGASEDKNREILQVCIGLVADVRFVTHKLTESLLSYHDDELFKRTIEAVKTLQRAFNTTLENFAEDQEGEALEGVDLHKPRSAPGINLNRMKLRIGNTGHSDRPRTPSPFNFKRMIAGMKYIDHIQAGRDGLHQLTALFYSFPHQMESKIVNGRINEFLELFDELIENIHSELRAIKNGFENGYPVVNSSPGQVVDLISVKLSKIPKKLIPTIRDKDDEFKINDLFKIVYTTEIPEKTKWAEGFIVTWIMNSVSNSFKAYRARRNAEGDEFNEELELVLSMKCTEENGKKYYWFALYDNGMGLNMPIKRFVYGEGGYDGKEASTTAGMASLLHSAQKFGGDMYLKNRKDQRGAVSVLKIQI